jgi:ribosomal protein S18 acetylase RimI-like enzyme
VAGTPTLNEAHIHSLVIDARHRGRGLGSVLLARLENQALNRGKIDAVLQVVTSNRTAQAFYRSRGYQPTGRTAAGIRRVLGYPTILMRKDLQRPAN